jgi:hypothetical protein
MYTRLTGRTCQGLADSCNTVASAALAGEVSATWLTIVAYTQLRLARDLTTDLRRPWERPASNWVG